MSADNVATVKESLTVQERAEALLPKLANSHWALCDEARLVIRELMAEVERLNTGDNLRAVLNEDTDALLAEARSANDALSKMREERDRLLSENAEQARRIAELLLAETQALREAGIANEWSAALQARVDALEGRVKAVQDAWRSVSENVGPPLPDEFTNPEAYALALTGWGEMNGAINLAPGAKP